MFALAVLHEELQLYAQHRMVAAMNRDSPSLVVGATNPLFTNATNLAGAALPTLVTPTRSLPVPPVIPSSAANTDIPMTPSGPVLLSDNNHSDFRPSASPGRTGFGSFSPHANPTNQSGSDRSDAQDSSSTHSCASPRSTLPAPRRPVPQVSLLSNVTNFLDASPNPAADPPVPDISSPMLHKPPLPTASLSPLTTSTRAARTSPSSTLGKPPQVHRLLSSYIFLHFFTLTLGVMCTSYIASGCTPCYGTFTVPVIDAPPASSRGKLFSRCQVP